MANINSVLDQRLKKGTNSSKMNAMARQSASGDLTSFSGLFGVTELSPGEKETIVSILTSYASEEGARDLSEDADRLLSLTSEVKAINNQAALLHGERIKKAHSILTNYREGAFTAWLMAAYGNRQTPYNLLHYYDFFRSMPKQLQPQIELMPRQAVYILASREGSFEKKQQVVENYAGETKAEMLALIRRMFPIEEQDRRRGKTESTLLDDFKCLYLKTENSFNRLHPKEKKQICVLLDKIKSLLS